MLAAQDHKKPSCYSLLYQHTQKLQHMHRRELSSGSPDNLKAAHQVLCLSIKVYPSLPSHTQMQGSITSFPLPRGHLQHYGEQHLFALWTHSCCLSGHELRVTSCKSCPAQILCHEPAYKQKHHRLSSCPANQLVFQKVFTVLTF